MLVGWLKPAENRTFSELSPSCSLAMIIMKSFRYQVMTPNNYSSSELQPLKFNKDFFQEFSSCLHFVLKSDKLLICGDFNIPVGFATIHLANELKGLITAH